MSEPITWLLELEVREGHLAEVRGLAAEMVVVTQAKEPRTLDYEWSLSVDGERCHILETYADSAAAVRHLASFGEHFAERFLEVLEPKRLTVYGKPSEELKDALAGYNPVYMKPLDGFMR